MHLQIFSPQWCSTWMTQINKSRDYRKSAAKWRWHLALKISDAVKWQLDEAILLDLWQGQCRDIRIANRDNLAETPFIISASLEEWQYLLTSGGDPIMSLMRGRMNLEKGSMVTLARFGGAAKALLQTALPLDTWFPNNPPVITTDTVLQEIAPSRTEAVLSTPLYQQQSQTVGNTGLRHQILPMRLYHKAKKLGIWNPMDIDFSQDVRDWQRLSALEKEVILHLTALFQAGEESVTVNLLPLMLVIAREGHLEEEMYLTTFLWEEAKHTEFFSRFLDEVVQENNHLNRFHSPAYQQIFYHELPAAMNALIDDPSPKAQVRASVTYNMIVEGTLAETGYHAYYKMLEENDLLPGLRQGIGYLKNDESRHIAYGIFLLSRLVAEDPTLWLIIEDRMKGLLEPALGIINQIFEPYPELPFGLKPETFIEYAITQFSHRMNRIERAKAQTLAEIYKAE